MTYKVAIEMEQPCRFYKEWLNENNIVGCELDYEGRLGEMDAYFECEEDAVAFKLRWM